MGDKQAPTTSSEVNKLFSVGLSLHLAFYWHSSPSQLQLSLASISVFNNKYLDFKPFLKFVTQSFSFLATLFYAKQKVFSPLPPKRPWHLFFLQVLKAKLLIKTTWYRLSPPSHSPQLAFGETAAIIITSSLLLAPVHLSVSLSLSHFYYY